MAIDFVLRNARLAGSAEPTDIAVERGVIAAVAPRIVSDAPAHDAGGRFVCGGLIETHIHLDKAGIIGRCAICEGTLAEAVRETAKANAAFTEEDVYARASAVLEKAVLAGTTRMRTFVEIDPRAGFRSFAAIKRLKADYEELIDVEICAFAQEGLTQEPETEAMIAQALGAGADSVGGCPYTDPKPAEHIARIFDLAARFGVAVDFHLDFDLDPAGSNLPTVIAETIRRSYGGRVSVGHVTKLSALTPADLDATAGRMAEAGVALTVLPATDLYLNGRAHDRLVPRGVALAHRLAEQGVLASVGTNNVMNPFTPFGDASLIRMANLYANVAHVGTATALARVFDMIASDAARLLGLSNYGIRPGSPADLVILDAASPAEAVATIAPPLAGWRRGRQNFVRPAATLAPRVGGAGGFKSEKAS
jgi:cytosine/creatinine deaminase